MGKFYKELQEQHCDFIAAQKMFFVGSAPLAPDGHINVSPKGLDSFRILSPNKVAYLDITGSGNETSAHLLENNRITIMFCAFSGAPNILRIYGSGYTVIPGDAAWDELKAVFPVLPGIRQIIVADVVQVHTSCGYGVPLYDYAGERDHAAKWAIQIGPEGLEVYMQQKNMVSLDGLKAPIARKFDPEATSRE